MNINQIIPELIVNNINEMIFYYQQYFDFILDATDPEDGAITWAQLSNGSSTIMMQEIEVTKLEIPELNCRIIGTDLLMFKLSSAKEVKTFYSRFKANESSIYIELHTTEYGSCEFGVKDPEGRYIIISG